MGESGLMRAALFTDNPAREIVTFAVTHLSEAGTSHSAAMDNANVASYTDVRFRTEALFPGLHKYPPADGRWFFSAGSPRATIARREASTGSPDEGLPQEGED